MNTTFDSKIIEYADKYGIPPQYLKRQVWQESGKTYDPSAYRYEPLSWDIGTKAGVGSDFGGLCSWSGARWSYHNLDFYRFPSGAGLFPGSGDMAIRDKFHYLGPFNSNVQPPTLPYSCNLFDTSNDLTEKLADIFNAEDGWTTNSYPYALYNSGGSTSVKGPCGGIRMNWSLQAGMSMAYLDRQYYCSVYGPPSPYPETECSSKTKSFTTWILNHPDYVAQTAVASSYGLLQVMYWNAVVMLHWNQNQGPQTRDPAALLHSDVSLDLGAHADCMFTQLNESAKLLNPPNLLDYQEAMARGINYYNQKWQGHTYGYDIVRDAYGFRPQ